MRQALGLATCLLLLVLLPLAGCVGDWSEEETEPTVLEAPAEGNARSREPAYEIDDLSTFVQLPPSPTDLGGTWGITIGRPVVFGPAHWLEAAPIQIQLSEGSTVLAEGEAARIRGTESWEAVLRDGEGNEVYPLPGHFARINVGEYGVAQTIPRVDVRTDREGSTLRGYSAPDSVVALRSKDGITRTAKTDEHGAFELNLGAPEEVAVDAGTGPEERQREAEDTPVADSGAAADNNSISESDVDNDNKSEAESDSNSGTGSDAAAPSTENAAAGDISDLRGPGSSATGSLAGGSAYTLQVTDKKGFTVATDHGVPYVRISLHPGDITGRTRPFTVVTMTLRSADGSLRGGGAAEADATGRFTAWIRDDQIRRVRPETGDVLVIHDGEQLREIEVAALEADHDLGTDRLAGLAPPDARIAVATWNPWRPGEVDSPETDVGESGDWEIESSVNLLPASHYYVTAHLPSGDQIYYCYQVPLLAALPGTPRALVEGLWEVEAALELVRAGNVVASASGGGAWSGDLDLVLRDPAGAPVEIMAGDTLRGMLDGTPVTLKVPRWSASLAAVSTVNESGADDFSAEELGATLPSADESSADGASEDSIGDVGPTATPTLAGGVVSSGTLVSGSTDAGAAVFLARQSPLDIEGEADSRGDFALLVPAANRDSIAYAEDEQGDGRASNEGGDGAEEQQQTETVRYADGVTWLANQGEPADPEPGDKLSAIYEMADGHHVRSTWIGPTVVVTFSTTKDGEIGGTAAPGSLLTARLDQPSGIWVTEQQLVANVKGKWSWDLRAIDAAALKAGDVVTIESGPWRLERSLPQLSAEQFLGQARGTGPDAELLELRLAGRDAGIEERRFVTTAGGSWSHNLWDDVELRGSALDSSDPRWTFLHVETLTLAWKDGPWTMLVEGYY